MKQIAQKPETRHPRDPQHPRITGFLGISLGMSQGIGLGGLGITVHFVKCCALGFFELVQLPLLPTKKIQSSTLVREILSDCKQYHRRRL